MQLKTHKSIFIATTNICNYLKNTVSTTYILIFDSYKISKEADNSNCTAKIMEKSLRSIKFSKYYDCFLATYKHK